MRTAITLAAALLTSSAALASEPVHQPMRLTQDHACQRSSVGVADAGQAYTVCRVRFTTPAWAVVHISAAASVAPSECETTGWAQANASVRLDGARPGDDRGPSGGDRGLERYERWQGATVNLDTFGWAHAGGEHVVTLRLSWERVRGNGNCSTAFGPASLHVHVYER